MKWKWLVAVIAAVLLAIVAFNYEIFAPNTGDKPHMTGKITGIDGQGRFLVVSKNEYIGTDQQLPEAVWYTMQKDAKIEFEGKKVNAQDVKIGSSVKVWGDGVMLESYPSQTTGVRMEITAKDAGKGDLSGKVTAVQKTGEGVNEVWTLHVDGVKYNLPQFAQVRVKEAHAKHADIKVGDKVKVWFSGYDIGTEKMVTQVMVE